ncbi:hypothetical protein Scep_017449 [Stephania cephalantha]|uniref:YdbS-like PH domain-containing protein n=1 Tax=Stephania cephalantha TaxID=152367 RepID=A0AAP0IRC5_9MAGN
MASSTTTITTTTTTPLFIPPINPCAFFTTYPCSNPKSRNLKHPTKLQVSNKPITPPLKTPPSPPSQETVFFDGGAHYGDLVANLLLGLTLLWLPLTLASVSRALFLRYRFTNLRVTVISGLTGQDRTDFSYKVIKDVQVVPRFIGEWGDIVITLKDGTKVDLRSVPKFRDIAQYCRDMADQSAGSDGKDDKPKGF